MNLTKIFTRQPATAAPVDPMNPPECPRVKAAWMALCKVDTFTRLRYTNYMALCALIEVEASRLRVEFSTIGDGIGKPFDIDNACGGVNAYGHSDANDRLFRLTAMRENLDDDPEMKAALEVVGKLMGEYKEATRLHSERVEKAKTLIRQAEAKLRSEESTAAEVAEAAKRDAAGVKAAAADLEKARKEAAKILAG